ncbi:MAG: bifunctional (p)ppGpp synthetase/guanosine-3',5'-bis(diphosphate) 3'-pyrophosphohydrolase [bacterium]
MLSRGIPKLEGSLHHRFEAVTNQIAKYAPGYNKELFKKAFEFACEVHDGQPRKSGDPYIFHPVEVAYVLAELEMDEPTIIAGLLHDAIEDGKLRRNPDMPPVSVTKEFIAAEFGSEIANLVDGVTKVGMIHFHNRLEQQAENLRRMLLATASDVRIILIKLADRFHNMRTIKYLKEEDQHRIADETLRIFAPIAHRLGIWMLKWELEDISLRVMDPEAYNDIKSRITRTRVERELVITTAISILEEKLKEDGIKGEIVGRPKHFYSIYSKMKFQGVDFDHILDLEAIRVILDSEKDCYSVLGIVHSLWTQLPGMFSDYINMPKPNGYQSLHTKVMGPHNHPMEVQIRTREMHRTAEVGVAAHWHYKEGGTHNANLDDKIAWVRDLLKQHADAKDNVDWLESLKVELFKDEVFVFTPNRDVIDLPTGSTPVDFAYRIHTNLGMRCSGARVNGKMVTLDYKFKNGDVVEIITRSNQIPNQDWLDFAVTSRARSKIKQFLRKEHREEHIQRGRMALEAACRRQGLKTEDVLKPEKLNTLIDKITIHDIDELYVRVGYGELTAEGVINRLRDVTHRRTNGEIILTEGEIPTQDILPVHVPSTGIDGILFRLSRCCQPIPGDAIVGYVTRGRGITIHRIDCPNAIGYSEDPEEAPRLTVLDWEDTGQGIFQAEIIIAARDVIGLIAQITSILAGLKVNIRTARTTSNSRQSIASLTMQIDTTGCNHIAEVIRQIRVNSNVIEVYRKISTLKKKVKSK